MKKKLLLVLLALTLTISAFMLVGCATPGLSYTKINGKEEYEVTGIGTATATNIVIAQTYNNLPVTRIGDEAFYDCSRLTSITIPNSVTSIGDDAFAGCDSLTYNTEGNLKYLGNSSNPYMYLADTTSTSITTAEINSNCRFIGSEAFEYCGSLTSVTIGGSVTNIGKKAFYNCISLTSVTIGGSVTSIGSYAFHGCIRLTSVTIPDSVTSIGISAFYGCKNLTSITIGNSVTSIGRSAFYNCSSLTSITIPNSVTSIGYSAFAWCSSLTIYCEATSQPSGWDSDWNYNGRPVYWYSETQPTTSGRYWHYVNGVVTEWE